MIFFFKFSSSGRDMFFNEMSTSDKIRGILGNLFMVEDAARLDYIKDKIAKRIEEIICYAECEK